MSRPGGQVLRYGIFQPGRAGDFVLTTGLFNALREECPGCHLTVVVGPRSRELARAHPAIDRVVVLDQSPVHLAAMLAALLRHRFAAWIDPKPHPSRNSVIAARLVRADRRIGWNGSSRVFDLALPAPADPPVHYARQALAPLPLLGLPLPPEPRLSLGLTAPAAEWARQERAGAEFTVLVNVSAGSGSRYWPYRSWRELLPRLARLRSTRFLLNAAPADRTAAVELAAAAAGQGADVRLLPQTDLLHVAAAVAAADAVLTVDTSIVHIAAAFDIPVLALFLRVEPVFTAYQPLSRVREVVAAPAGEPMAAVPVAEVEAAWQRLLGALAPVPGGSGR
ncbi:MAG: glycosyltransferase family 9 protein [Gemmatimonadales bacterium]